MVKRQKMHEIIGFSDHKLLLVGIPVAGLLMSMLLFNEEYIKWNWSYLMVCIPISMVYTASFWLLMRLAYQKVRFRFPHSNQVKHRMLRLVPIFFAIFIVTNVVLDNFFGWALPSKIPMRPGTIIIELLAAGLLASLVLTLYEAASFYLLLHRSEQEKADIQRHYVQSQLEGLRNQVNPHFLFNSLNTLIYLIPEDPDRAVNFVQKLSKVYRYVLESRDASIIPLRDEVDYLNAYVFLLRERFGDNLRVQIADFGTDLNKAIVPLTLQMLFENAIKHNVISIEKPLLIEVFIEKNKLIVRNTLQLKNQVMHSTGVGLENIKARYQLLTKHEVGVIISREYFTVLLPLLNMNDVAIQSSRVLTTATSSNVPVIAIK
jgi:two-component system, LytTR family, sensor kinase